MGLQPSTTVANTLEERVAVAIKTRKVFLFDDSSHYDVEIPIITKGDIDADIRTAQKRYERRYNARKEEARRAEKKVLEDEVKRSEEKGVALKRKLAELDEGAINHSVVLNDAPEPSRKRQKLSQGVILSNDSSQSVPDLKSEKKKQNTQNVLPGKPYPIPCVNCADTDSRCLAQFPRVFVACAKCHDLRQKCSFCENNPPMSRGRNREKEIVEDEPYSQSAKRESLLDDSPVARALLDLTEELKGLATEVRESVEIRRLTNSRLDEMSVDLRLIADYFRGLSK